MDSHSGKHGYILHQELSVNRARSHKRKYILKKNCILRNGGYMRAIICCKQRKYNSSFCAIDEYSILEKMDIFLKNKALTIILKAVLLVINSIEHWAFTFMQTCRIKQETSLAQLLNILVRNSLQNIAIVILKLKQK